jgi:hypothetical protein
MKLTNLQFKLARDCGVFVCLAGEVTQEAIQRLIDLLNLSRDAYPTADELSGTTEGGRDGVDVS